MGFRGINIIATKRAKLCIWYFKVGTFSEISDGLQL